MSKLIKYFNAVIAKDTGVKETVLIKKHGIVIMPSAAYARREIVDYAENCLKCNDALNKTFNKSWRKIINSTDEELLMEQITHYISGYGTGFTGELFIPNEVLNVPDVEVKLLVINGKTPEELQQSALNMLKSGISLKSETVKDLMSILKDDLAYELKAEDVEEIKNKEAICMVADATGFYPKKPEEFLRFLIYKASERQKLLLIKDESTIEMIKTSGFNPQLHIKKYGLKKLSTIFNRFKPIFLAWKNKCPAEINEISRLSKKNHKPMAINPLSVATSKRLDVADNSTKGYVASASVFNLIRVLNSLRYYSMTGKGTASRLYSIRNGKVWATEKKHGDKNLNVINENIETIKDELKKRLSFLKGRTIYLPNNIEYAAPVSEKMFAGNIPYGTVVYGKNIIAGFYWHDSSDFDLSSIDTMGNHVGWNASKNKNGVVYSGDITNGEHGAAEYLRFGELFNDTIIRMNVYKGCLDWQEHRYKIIVGNAGKKDEINRDYIINPNKLFFQADCVSTNEENIIGIVSAEEDHNRFYLWGGSLGNLAVARKSDEGLHSLLSIKNRVKSMVSLREILALAGAEFPEQEDCDAYDDNLCMENLSRATLTDLLTEE